MVFTRLVMSSDWNWKSCWGSDSTDSSQNSWNWETNLHGNGSQGSSWAYETNLGGGGSSYGSSFGYDSGKTFEPVGYSSPSLYRNYGSDRIINYGSDPYHSTGGFIDSNDSGGSSHWSTKSTLKKF